MRPIRLELTNFTIFRGTHNIDFSGLRFFAIQGRTGSGKTSLIDAICYALYARVPRHGRENLHENIISKGEDRMRVFFEFAVKDRRYAIERFVRQGRATARVYENGKPKDIKINEIPDFVRKVLKVDYETFTKVILLPQGHFDRFLRPERPQQRREILNKLLGMDTLLSKLSELIREAKRQIESELALVESTLNQLAYATKEELERIQEKIKLLTEEIRTLSLKREELQGRIEVATQRDNLQKDLFDCERELEELLSKENQIKNLEREVEKMEEALSYSAYVESYENLSKQEELERAEIKTLELKLIKLDHEKRQVLKQLELYRNEWERIGQYDSEIEELTRKIQELELALGRKREMDKNIQELEHTLDRIRVLEKDIKHLEDRIQRGEKFIREKESYVETLELKQRRLMEITPIKLKLDEVKRERQTLKELLEKIKSLEEEIEKLEQMVKEKELQILNFHVHNIRSQIKVGDVCPVCGNIVKELPKEVFEADFENLKREYDNLRKRERQLSEEKARIESRMLSIQQREEELSRLLGQIQEDELEAEYEELEKSVQSIEEERSILRKAKEKLEKLRQELNSKINELSAEKAKAESLKANIENIENYLKAYNLEEISEDRLRALKNELNSKKTRREEIRKNYHQLSEKIKQLEVYEQELQTKKSERERNIERIREEKAKHSKNLEPAIKKFGDLATLKEYIKPREYVRQLRDDIERYKNRISLLVQKKDELREELKKFSDLEPTEEIRQKLRSVEDRLNNYNVELGQLREQKTRLEEDLKRKEELKKRKEELERRGGVYNSLERDFRADRLQEFISQIMLQRIISISNFYMQKFTSGAYEFDLKGGDLVILDRLSGYERSVSTLSGGETFLASLSLAFGISDLISHNASIESLFIDEGFGSLDKETREGLSQFFELIKQNTDRIVGIITHIEDLAERFDQRIEVIRRGDRSYLKVIT